MFLTDTPQYKAIVEESKYITRFKNFLCEHSYDFEPKYFITLFYGRSYEGHLLEEEDYRKRWDIVKVRKTHRFIRKQITKVFGEIPMVFCIERHIDKLDPVFGDKKGSFHTHLYLGDIPNVGSLGTDPLVQLWFWRDYFGQCLNTYKDDIDIDLKKQLLEVCIRQAKWVGKYPDSLRIDEISHMEFHRTFRYGLKQIENEDDINNVIDWDNSKFMLDYQED